MRISGTGLRVLKAFMYNPGQSLHGYEIMTEAGVSSGTLYPLLMRFEEHGLLSSEWEQPEPNASGRPRRRLYRITGEGQRTAYALIGSFQAREAL